MTEIITERGGHLDRGIVGYWRTGEITTPELSPYTEAQQHELRLVGRTALIAAKGSLFSHLGLSNPRVDMTTDFTEADLPYADKIRQRSAERGTEILAVTYERALLPPYKPLADTKRWRISRSIYGAYLCAIEAHIQNRVTDGWTAIPNFEPRLPALMQACRHAGSFMDVIHAEDKALDKLYHSQFNATLRYLGLIDWALPLPADPA